MTGGSRFPLDPLHAAALNLTPEGVSGEIFHVAQNRVGSGSVWTPVGRFFTTRQPHEDDVHLAHWRVDCFVRRHRLAPDPEKIGLALVELLQREHACEAPIWVSWYMSEELGGRAVGEVWDD